MLIVSFYVAEMESTLMIPDDLDDNRMIHHRPDYVINRFYNLINSESAIIDSDLDPILIKVKSS